MKDASERDQHKRLRTVLRTVLRIVLWILRHFVKTAGGLETTTSNAPYLMLFSHCVQEAVTRKDKRLFFLHFTPSISILYVFTSKSEINRNYLRKRLQPNTDVFKSFGTQKPHTNSLLWTIFSNLWNNLFAQTLEKDNKKNVPIIVHSPPKVVWTQIR